MPATVSAQCECADVAGEAALLATVGAGLGARAAAAAALAAHALGADAALGAASVRFWGKLLGVHADYYVFEAALRPADEPAGASHELSCGKCMEVLAIMGIGLSVCCRQTACCRGEDAPPMQSLEELLAACLFRSHLGVCFFTDHAHMQSQSIQSNVQWSLQHSDHCIECAGAWVGQKPYHSVLTRRR